MLSAFLALLIQSATITGSLAAPEGMAPPASAQVVLLPSQYANVFNAEAQRRIDNYWEIYKPQFAEQKELFRQVFPVSYRDALDTTLLRMRRDSKVDSGSLIRTVTAGHFEFRGVPPGDYKIVASGSIQNKDYFWTEALHVGTAPIFLQMKNRVP